MKILKVYGEIMSLRTLFSIVLVAFSFSAFSKDSMLLFPIVEVPSYNSYVTLTKVNKEGSLWMRGTLVNPYENTIVNGGDFVFKLFEKDNPKMIDVFLDEKEYPETLFVLFKKNINDSDRKIVGTQYKIFRYEIDKGFFRASRIPILAWDNCIDGENHEKNKTLTCRYKDRKSILNFLKYGMDFDNGKIKKIKDKKLYLYTSSEGDTKTEMYLIKNDVVKVLETKNNWLHILFKGKKDILGWIPIYSVVDL